MKKLNLYFLLFLIALGFSITVYHTTPLFKKIINTIYTSSSFFDSHNIPKTQHWITVFVHGSFGSVLSFLSIPQVLNDDLKGSLYRKINKKMRKESIFYQDQAMLDKGFKNITPTFDITSTTSNRAAFPIIQAYKSILESTHPKHEKHHFYTFGWSGLVSQYRRRYEAVRLYNHLVEEYEKFECQGITPKIRLIAHSHGGNVCLNLAAIEKILHQKYINENHKFSENPDENESIKQMFKIISQFPNKETAIQKKGQKQYNYVPKKSRLSIDELIMFGTPIQPETASFVLSDIFKKIYNIYSEEDTIQKLDILSTKGYAVHQRIRPEILTLAKNKNKIRQVKIMYGRNFETTQPNQSTTQKNKPLQEEPTSFWSKLLSLGISFSKKYNDPSHKELWFISWKEKECPHDFCIAPLPTVIFTPVLLILLNQLTSCNDSDINIIPEKDTVKLQILKHDHTTIEKTYTLSLQLIQSIKKNIEKWKPDDLSGASEFDAISQHLS